MSTYRNTPGFEPFKATQSGRSLADYGEQYQIRERAFVNEQDLQEYSLQTRWHLGVGWVQIVFDPQQVPILRAVHPEREGDAWDLMRQLLDSAGITVHPAPETLPPH